MSVCPKNLTDIDMVLRIFVNYSDVRNKCTNVRIRVLSICSSIRKKIRCFEYLYEYPKEHLAKSDFRMKPFMYGWTEIEPIWIKIWTIQNAKIIRFFMPLNCKDCNASKYFKKYLVQDIYHTCVLRAIETRLLSALSSEVVWSTSIFEFFCFNFLRFDEIQLDGQIQKNIRRIQHSNPIPIVFILIEDFYIVFY